jgi:hypothetical protein
MKDKIAYMNRAFAKASSPHGTAGERFPRWPDSLSGVGDCAYWFRIVSICDVGVVGEKPILAYRFHAHSVTLLPSLLIAPSERGNPLSQRRHSVSHQET